MKDLNWMVSTLNRSMERENPMGWANDVRFTRWAGQSGDGRKWQANLPEGKRVFPYDGASDTRIPLVDDVINSMVDLCTTSFWKGGFKVNPAEVGDVDKAHAAQRLIDHLLNAQLYTELTREVELLAQYAWTAGWSAMHVSWQQEMSLRYQEIALEQIMELGQQVPELADLPQMIQNPDAADQVAELLMQVMPGLRKRRALKAVRELREQGVTKVPVPSVRRNSPSVAALVPWSEIIIPPETVDLEHAEVIYRREYMTEDQLRAKAAVAGWNEEWVEAAIATKGSSSEFVGRVPYVAEVGITDELERTFIEVIWAYHKEVDEDGVPGVYCTVFCPAAIGKGGTELYAKQDLLDYGHGCYPFVLYRPESVHRRVVESRGVPQIAFTWQQEVKIQRDSIADYTSFSTLPPLEVPKSRAGNLTLRPAGQLPVLKRGEVGFLEVPQREPRVAFELQTTVERQVDEYFGRMRPDGDPTRAQLRQQRIVNNWLHTWSNVCWQLVNLCAQYYSPEEIQRITGMVVEFDTDTVKFDMSLKYDVRELHTDFITAKLKAIADFVLPADAAGVVDRAKLVGLALRAIDPNMAEMIVQDQAGAATKVYNEQRDTVAQMYLGNEAVYQDRDPAAAMRLQMTQNIVSQNPNYQQAFLAEGRAKELMEKYLQHLQFQLQQQQNAQIGRIGVEPMGGGM
jgi:hypothetical protein